MTKDELYRMASNVSREVIAANQDMIDTTVKEMFKPYDGRASLSPSEAFAAAAVVATRTAPEISAAITARMLIDLGLVAVEDD